MKFTPWGVDHINAERKDRDDNVSAIIQNSLKSLFEQSVGMFLAVYVASVEV